MEGEDKKDNKKNIIIGVIVLLGLLLLGFAAMGPKASYKGDATGVPEASQVAPVEKSKLSSLKELLSSNATTKCTVSTSNDQADTQGVVYTSSGKMRTDYEMTLKGKAAQGKKITSHMIVDESFSYMWGDQMPMGIKMSRAEIDDIKSNADGTTPTPPTSKETAIDMNQQADYNCNTWSADNSLFTPPSDVKFTDMSAMLKNIPKAPVGGVAPASGTKIPTAGSAPQSGLTSEQLQAMCGSCDQAGEGRAQCRAALGCK